jgi:phage host-nuclease inhibitor protein Gam
MSNHIPAFTKENEELTKKLEFLHLEFISLYARHKDMVENESVILTSLYLEKLGRLQLELLEKQTEASRLKMKMNLIQAAINRNEQPDLQAVEHEINMRLKSYYAQIQLQSAAIDEAAKVLSHLISEEETQKLKEIFRALCKRLHPDLNPNQTEEEKDLFIKVKAAYDLQRLTDLQNMLLYLDDSNNEKLLLISSHEKAERIKHLENQIISLKQKIEQLKQSFPFNLEEIIYDEAYILKKQEELRILIKTSEEEIVKYTNIINIMIDE